MVNTHEQCPKCSEEQKVHCFGQPNGQLLIRCCICKETFMIDHPMDLTNIKKELKK